MRQQQQRSLVGKNRKYTDAEKGAILARLEFNGGNVKGTAREFDMPPATLNHWKVDLEKYRNNPAESTLSEAVTEAIVKHAGDFVEKAESIRDQALDRISVLIPSTTEKNISALVSLMSNLTDRIDRAKGIVDRTTVVQHEHKIAAPSEWASALAEYASLARSEAIQRTEEIIDVDWTEQPTGLLPSPQGE
jgi:transposase-like protein